MTASVLFLLLVLLLVASLILFVSRRNDGRDLNAVLLLAGRLVTAFIIIWMCCKPFSVLDVVRPRGSI